MSAVMTKEKSENVVWHEPSIPTWEIEQLNGHKGATIWFTGLPSSGKSTLANALARELMLNRIQTFVLDGDNIRHGLNGNLGFSTTDRQENIRRIAEVAKLFSAAGLVNLVAFVSPYRADRAAARKLQPGRFLEVYCHTPLSVCESRDPKGLYKRARAGEIREFTGIDDPYEPPEDPDLVVETAKYPLDVCVEMIITAIESRGIANVKRRHHQIPEPAYTD